MYFKILTGSMLVYISQPIPQSVNLTNLLLIPSELFHLKVLGGIIDFTCKFI